jgi:hypothetical protein
VPLLAALLALALALLAGAPAHAAAEVPRRADAFADSVGINVHFTYRDTPYADAERVIAAIHRAGIRHVRDGLVWDTPYAYPHYRRLAALGIRSQFIMGELSGRTGSLAQLLWVLEHEVRDAAGAVEGPNETPVGADPARLGPALRAYQRRLHRAVKGTRALAHLPVVAPSFVTWQDRAGFGRATDMLDFGNLHPYPNAEAPGGNLEAELGEAARVSAGRPVFVTETGYHNATAQEGGHRGASERAVAAYLPRLYLEYFRRGVVRTFAYELVDEWADPTRRHQESHFGLLRHDFSPKPAYRTLANLLGVLADPGPRHPVRPLDLAVTDGPEDLRRLLLQRRDGAYQLALWREVAVWDPEARADRPAAARTVALALPRAVTAARIARPGRARGRGPWRAVRGALAVRVGAHPVVVELRRR